MTAMSPTAYPSEGASLPGVRVVLDARPLQEPERNPTTALYLERLLGAFAAQPMAGESFVLVLGSPGDDPSGRFPGLVLAGRRRLPPTRRLRAATLALDPFLLRGAAIGTAFGARREGAAGVVYHAVGGTLPLASGLPLVATLLDLAAAELPAVYQRSPAERFGQRLRARILRDARRLIVPSAASAETAARALHVPRERVRVIPLAPTLPAPDPRLRARSVALRERLGFPERYLLFAGRHDARKDLRTLFRSLALLAAAPAPDPEGPWPPSLVLAGMSEADGAALERTARDAGIAPLVRIAARLEPAELAALMGGARAFVYPALTEANGLAVIEALALGTPVVASKVGALPELVAQAGILVEPRDAERLAAALATLWSDERIHRRLAGSAHARARGPRRSWADVAAETRVVYAEAAGAVGV